MDEIRWIALIIGLTFIIWGLIKFIRSWREFYPKGEKK